METDPLTPTTIDAETLKLFYELRAQLISLECRLDDKIGVPRAKRRVCVVCASKITAQETKQSDNVSENH